MSESEIESEGGEQHQAGLDHDLSVADLVDDKRLLENPFKIWGIGEVEPRPLKASVRHDPVGEGTDLVGLQIIEKRLERGVEVSTRQCISDRLDLVGRRVRLVLQPPPLVAVSGGNQYVVILEKLAV